MQFLDRVDAGRRLAQRVEHLQGEDVVVLGLPRGGVPVARQVADALHAPLDVIVVRKLGVPFQPELGMGAIGEDDALVVNEDIVRLAGVTDEELVAVEARERTELERRARRFRGSRPRTSLEGRTALIVDDGIATGSTARAACQVARAHGARRVVLAVPVAPRGWEARIGRDADELIAVATPESFGAVGQFYLDFSQTTDAEVVACLDPEAGDCDAGAVVTAGADDDDPPDFDADVIVTAGAVRLAGRLMIPEDATGNGIVVFAHGSGSSRHSPRNRFVAEVLHQGGIGTLLLDLLTHEEELDRTNVFRCRRGPVGGGGTGLEHRRDRVPRRSPRPRRAEVGRGHRTDPVDRRRPRRRRHRPQPAGPGAPPMPQRARGRAGRDPSLRGAGHARGSSPVGARVVRRSSDPEPHATATRRRDVSDQPEPPGPEAYGGAMSATTGR